MTETTLRFERLGRIGRIVLDRPKALNALTLEQVHAMHPQLDLWAADPDVALVVIEGAGERAFCAGGDIKRLHRAAAGGESDYLTAFYRDEYRFNRRIKTLPKPYVALLDGITMGGGVGVSVHGRYRVATERTLFAMPETGIGFYPDVGLSFVLSRLPGAIGRYLGMTGARLGPADTLHVGIATHYVESGKIDSLRDALAGAEGDEDVAAILARFASDPGPTALDGERALIDRCFAHDRLDDVLAALAAETDPFAAETLAVLRRHSPLLVAITFEMIRRAASMEFDECLRMEYRLSQVVARAPDFVEGVRALLIDRDNSPVWNPATLAELTPAQVLAPFETVPAAGDLTF
ncbi:enoyl-CoA hydratase/isomerase family protein [Magnetospirillum fulvum]|uniref:3-hydroxyisobutyryl-CoA hydrolase n=1 Tax=Magnetospirillum fulvum MGU-K5 TaxID=1316936 RepID=S9SEI3_MAGFU|nr:enoyl-CoA hydratase/isomerase family protein [Magnetospirillum fulvum]EPY03124.1 enoyl-CoA hydratase/carnithine racemase [Magnetospirillum fulvum MGU-K5]